MAVRAQTAGYLVGRRTTSDSYQMWRFDPNGREMLTPVPLDEGASYDRRNSLVWIGGYLLGWGPSRDAIGAPYYDFHLIPFDPASRDPLSAPPLQHGQWSKHKFWGLAADFGNPEGGQKQYDTEETLTLIPLGTFLLNFIPTDGRGTFGVWNFDPCPTAPGTADPVPGHTPFTPQGSFRDMQIGDELIPFNGYVLDRRRATGEYRLWSFDPQARIPLARPEVQQGTWPTTGPDHELVPIGEYVLDWEDVRLASDSHAVALEFAASAFRHACNVCDWDPALAASAEGTPPPIT